MVAVKVRKREEAEIIELKSVETHIDRLARIISETEKLGPTKVSGSRDEYLAHILANSDFTIVSDD